MRAGSGQQPPVVILGAGYTGRHLYALASERGLTVLASSRSPDEHLAQIPAPHRILFDLDRPETWKNIPSGAHLIWCFPAVPESTVAAFAGLVVSQTCRLIVLGSTAAYTPPPAAPDPLIDESSGINRGLPRVRGEEHLRLHHRATVLRVAGIYGPGRNPLNWIRLGKVTASSRCVNLIHVEDLASICLLALERAKPGEVYNISDGQPRSWAEICAIARRRWGVVPQEPREDTRPGKRISTAKLQADLGYRFRYPDLYTALDELESAEASKA
jgi:nucleoside-diphosphate-sugar epimerase